MFEVRNLSSAYGQSEVLHGIDLAVTPGEIVALVGRNGMGKSTLMKSLIGVMPARSGQILVDGTDVTALAPHQRVARGLAYVPQGRQIFGTMTVKENIETGLVVTGKREIPREIFDLFPILADFESRRGGNLSGGQQQQLAIARALASDPKVLLLDEPTEGIQPSIIKDDGAAAARYPQRPQSLHRRLRASAQLRPRHRRPHLRHGGRTDCAHRQPRACRRSDDCPVPGGLTAPSRPTERNHASNNGQEPYNHVEDLDRDRPVGVALQERHDPQPLAPGHSDGGLAQAWR
jgi:urea transport system ATP-binding protein